MRTKSFRHDGGRPGDADPVGPDLAAPEPAGGTEARPSFWRRLFGGRPVRKEDLRTGRAKDPPVTVPGAAAAGRAGKPHPASPGSTVLPVSAVPGEVRPRNPKSFLAKKFNSQVVKAALLDAIGEAMDHPPPDIAPVDSKFWVEGLALKGVLVEQLDCPRLKPEEHLRAIQWMAKVERLNPIKATYREDLFSLRFQVESLQDKPSELPEAVGQGGVALRRLYQVIRTKLEGLGRLEPEASALAQQELAAYERLMETIDRAPLARLGRKDQLRLSNVFRRIDPYRLELTTRHARFAENIAGLIREMEEVYASAAIASDRCSG